MTGQPSYILSKRDKTSGPCAGSVVGTDLQMAKKPGRHSRTQIRSTAFRDRWGQAGAGEEVAI